MTDCESNAFSEANKRVHAVETQWHYPIMTKFGYEPDTKYVIGFVRSYEYRHSSGHRMTVSTGVNCDHWSDLETGAVGYWSSLEPHLKKQASAIRG